MSDSTSLQKTQRTGTLESATRKPYRRPVVAKLGSVREMTKSINNVGKLDGRSSRRTGRGGLVDC